MINYHFKYKIFIYISVKVQVNQVVLKILLHQTENQIQN